MCFDTLCVERRGQGLVAEPRLYSGGLAPFFCSCSRTLAVSRGSVVICHRHGRPQTIARLLGACDSQLSTNLNVLRAIPCVQARRLAATGVAACRSCVAWGCDSCELHRTSAVHAAMADAVKVAQIGRGGPVGGGDISPW